VRRSTEGFAGVRASASRSDNKNLFPAMVQTQPKEIIMQFGSKSVSLEDRHKHRLGVETDNGAIGVTK
jgi:hypothetical protein